jgi:hypothetical protein
MEEEYSKIIVEELRYLYVSHLMDYIELLAEY